MRRSAVLAVLVLTIGGVAACGDGVTPSADGESSGRSTPDLASGAAAEVKVAAGAGEVQGIGLVLENADHGPQLCLGGVGYSYPPQCTGEDLVGWDWAEVDGAERASGATWGLYAVTGVWDGERLTVTDVRLSEDGDWPPSEDLDFATPCEPPPGGWVVIDPATATDEAMRRALDDASGEPDFGGAWIDQRIDVDPDDADAIPNDPTKLVLNVMFTGDLERHEAEIHQTWGGPLCVSTAPRSRAELLEIQRALRDEPGVLSSGPNDRAGTLDVSVLIDDGLQEHVNQEYGPGVVVVWPALVPVAR